MAAIIAWIGRFLSGFAIWKADKIGKILYFAVLFVVFAGIFYCVFLKKTIANNQRTVIEKGATANYYTYYQDCSNKTKDDTFSLLKLWRLRLLSVR